MRRGLMAALLDGAILSTCIPSSIGAD